MIGRREFIRLLGGAAMSWPVSALSQSRRSIGVLMNGSPGEPVLQSNVAAFVEGMRALGYVDGQNIHFEYRWNGGNAERAITLAAELVGLEPSVILSASTTNLNALRRATSSVPVVFLQVSDPVAQGFVTSVTHPGSNFTGFSAYEFSIGGKWLELLKEIAPKLSRVGVMSNPETSPQTKFFQRAIEAAGPALGIQIIAVPVRNDSDIARAIEGLAGPPPGGLILPTDTYTRLRQGRIADIANQYRVPVLSASPDFIDEGGLMFYGGTSVGQLAVQFRQAATYVDRILKGSKPGDLPIQGAVKFELAINRKTAGALGLEIPPKLLFTADRVIE
jgi:putative ABC transport system substrate-binding protein